jgi:hypothetical protein
MMLLRGFAAQRKGRRGRDLDGAVVGYDVAVISVMT